MPFYRKNHVLRKEIVSFLDQESQRVGTPRICHNLYCHLNKLQGCLKSYMSFIILKLPKCSKRRASSFSSGSVTVEAALAIPMFFLALLCMVFLLEMNSIQVKVRSGMHEVAKSLAKDAYVVPILSPGNVERDMVESIGSGRLNQSIVVGGSSGLDCSGSYISPGTAMIHLKVRYKVRIPVPVFIKSNITFDQGLMIKGWTGYEKGGMESDANDIVYVTDTASVYHRNYHCSHLDLSIQMVSGSNVGELRNEYQGKYHACSKCARGVGEPSGPVYVAKEGDCYHTSLGCSGLKRKVYAVPLSQVVGKGACSRCGQ